jgi:hypothetical protein
MEYEYREIERVEKLLFPNPDEWPDMVDFRTCCTGQRFIFIMSNEARKEYRNWLISLT